MPFVPVASPQALLPTFSLADLGRDSSRLDASGFDGDTCGGVSLSFVTGVRANSFGHDTWIIVAPNDDETNQSCTGDIAIARLACAFFANGAAQDTITCTWTMPVTKRGAPRAWSSVATLASGPTFTVGGVWADTTTRINMFRTKWIFAPLGQFDQSSQDQFLQSIPAGGLSHYNWQALGNP